MAEVLRLHATGAQAVEETWRKFVPSARLQRVDPRTFSFSWASASMPGFSLVGYELTATVHSEVVPSDQLMACRVDTPDGRVWSTRKNLDAAQPWLFADRPIAATWNGAAQVRAFVFDRDAAATTARTLTGDDRLVLRVDDPEVRSGAWAAHWENTYRYVRSSLATAAATEGETSLVEAELRRTALVSTLMAFSTSFLHAGDHVAQTRAAPVAVRRAVAFITDNADAPITVDDVAQAAGISTRGLQLAFRRALGMTPTAYLRKVRLSGAHDELAARPGVPVRDVALRWGFADASRFAKYYREEYGRNPQVTARGV
ncbi:helix-turn-helix transcriptional regulator [Microbacterium sp. 1P10UB]|uniref:AraC family transcriptional regulator n=1 Tax=unclassified Microbacterium TaxID=2609290 RepID=UPI0039A3D823